MEKKALAELAEVAEENVGNHPCSVVKVGLCAVTAGKVVRLGQGQGPSQNDLRLKLK